MFDFVGKRNIFFIISAVIIIAGFVALVAFGGFNADIDFTGGYTMTVRVMTTATAEKTDAVKEDTNKDEKNKDAASDETNSDTKIDEAADTAQSEELVKSEVVTSEKTKVSDKFVFSEDEIRNSLKGIDAIKSLSVVKTDDGFVLKFNELQAQDISKIKTALADKYGQIRIISEDHVSGLSAK